MKLASFIRNGEAGYGLIDESGLRPAVASFLRNYPTLRAVIAAQRVDELADNCEEAPLPLDQVALSAPIPEPGKILCIGMNYPKPYPVEGVAPPNPENIIVFARHSDTLVGHGAPLERPRGAAAETFDFEGEIAAVIGKPGRHIALEDAMAHVIGYAAMNEGSVRGWMKHSVHAGKNFHASGAWGPWIATTDETGDIADMRLETWVNGALMQSTTGAGMIFDLPRIIAYLSHLGPLNAGDVIATGSPDGTGGSRKPSAFLKTDDLVEVSVSGVGALKNRVGA